MKPVFHQRVAAPGVRIANSWPEDHPWGLRAHMAFEQVEFEYVVSLLREIRDKNIPGDLAEFGIFDGLWINFFYEQTEQLGLPRRIYGFDSFEGLSDSDPKPDSSFCQKGSIRLQLRSGRAKCCARFAPADLPGQRFFREKPAWRRCLAR